MNVGSLFSGIGGLDLGLERAGMTVKWQVEIDPYCRRVLAKYWPDVERYEDVREVGQHNLERVDLICGGFPCQPVSHAGQRKGTADGRWLWPEFARLVCEMRPRWVLAENVPGLLSIDAGRVFGGILRDLAACGYDCEWDCIPAAAVGAPHRRDRVFILARRIGDSTGPRSGNSLADAGRMRELDARQPPLLRSDQTGSGQGCEDVAESGESIRRRSARLGRGFRQSGTLAEEHERNRSAGDGQWATEPDVGRVATGVPRRVDRLRGLGNAVVPQVAEWIGRRIMANCK